MSIQNKVLEYFSSSIKALPFAKWAKPKQTELNIKRTRTLSEKKRGYMGYWRRWCKGF